MYSRSQFTIGQNEVISFRDENDCGIDIIPKLGGALHQLYLGSPAKPILHGFENGADESNPLYKQTILFPFPNRLSEGIYKYKGMDYQFPINEPNLNNALHGFLNNVEFKLHVVTNKDYDLILRLQYEYDGYYDHYPFPCIVNIEYRVAGSSLSVIFRIENTGPSELVYGLGWHPYFKFDKSIKVKFPTSKRIMVDRQMIPDGREENFDQFANGAQMKGGLDSCFRINDTDQLRIELEEENNHKLIISADESLKYLQLYSPVDSIMAVEPMSCAIDAFNNGKGLIELIPGESRSHVVDLRYEPL